MGSSKHNQILKQHWRKLHAIEVFYFLLNRELYCQSVKSKNSGIHNEVIKLKHTMPGGLNGIRNWVSTT